MFRKAIYSIVGLSIVGGLLLGSNAIPYVQTAFNNIRSTAHDSVPVAFQLDAAKSQLKKIDPEIKDMVWQIAKEKAQVKKLGTQVEQQNAQLKRQYDEMMTLREHVGSGEKFYVGTNGKAYTNERVQEDLRHRFTMYQTAEKTREKSKEILNLRQASLDSALAQLDEAKQQQRELEIQIENLQARHRMNEVVATASQINIDNSQLSKTREMIEDIDARLSTQEEMLNLIPKYTGQIPVDADQSVSPGNILDDMDAYFNQSSPKSNDQNDQATEVDDLVFN
jgi:chromosome segregation ATPase